VHFTPIRSEALVRLLIADLVGEKVTRQSLATLRTDLKDLAGRLDDSAAAAKALPHRSKYLLIANSFLRDLLKLHEELVERVERELDAE
jgi:hypothetical protein